MPLEGSATDQFETPKRRSFGVTAVATLILVGSVPWILLALLATVIAISRLVTSHHTTQSPWIVLIPLWTFAVFSSCGVATAIGLLRLKNWARVSTLVFSAPLLFIGAGGLMGILLQIPGTGGTNPQATRLFVFFIGLPALIISGWWLYLFNKPSVKTQFVPMSDPVNSAQKKGRPLSITVIAVLFLFVAIQSVLYIRRGWPQSFLGFTITGWGGIAVSLLSAAISLYCGVGLFRLQEIARKVAVGFSIYGIVNTLLFTLFPGAGDRIAASMAQFPQEMQQAVTGISPVKVALYSVVTALIPGVIQLWFLTTRRWAFQKSR